ncbi:MAG: M1 family aminopeptidase [Ignavibacteriales bacterium]|nr:M1 family aminopeptidase [Ignavibacteriales bacterium]
MNKLAFFSLLLGILACPAAHSQTGDAEFDALQAREMQRFASLSRSLHSARILQPGVDAKYYRLNIRIADAKDFVRGDVTSLIKVTDGTLSKIMFDLTNAMLVDSAFVDGLRSPVSAAGNAITITLPRIYNTGELLQSRVYYHGNPPYTGLGSYSDNLLTDGTRWTYTLSEPYGARDWWPCIDHPNDKADSADIWITCKQNTIGVSNGKLIETVQNADLTRTFKWKHRYPIATYLIPVTIGNFNTFSDWYRYSPTDSMEVVNYVLPSIASTSPLYRSSAALTPRMLGIYSAMFGTFPFIKEKYGHAQFGWSGGMEHQTLTSLGSTAFTEATIAHELVHQWFGDMITCRTWPDLWLNEGFAQYFEAVYREKQYGMDSYWSRMQSRISSAKSATGTLYVQDSANVDNLFASSRVYNKGSFVLQMLRFALGDSIFFASIRSYASDPALRYGTAATADLRRHCETVSGRDLAWFFNEWVFGEKYPKYSYSYSHAPGVSGYVSTINIRQTTGTTNPSFFTMPIPLKFIAAGWDTTVRVDNNAANQTFQIAVSHKPDTIQFDPQGWLLRDVTKVANGIAGLSSAPLSFSLGSNYPNPFNPSTTIRYTLPVRCRVTIAILNPLGQRVVELVNEDQPAGEKEVQWNAVAASGIYFYRMEAAASDIPGITYTKTRRMVLVR